MITDILSGAGEVNADCHGAIIPIYVKRRQFGVLHHLIQLDAVTRIAQRQTIHGCHHIAGLKPKASNAARSSPGAMR